MSDLRIVAGGSQYNDVSVGEVMHMRIWRRIRETASRSPRGYVADGRTLGLGLATAMDKARQDTADVEAYLRDRAESPAEVGGRL